VVLNTRAIDKERYLSANKRYLSANNVAASLMLTAMLQRIYSLSVRSL